MTDFEVYYYAIPIIVTLIIGEFFYSYLNKNIKRNENEKINPSWRKSTPDPYYESDEYKKFCEERKKNYGLIINKTEDMKRTYRGKRGGRYTKDKTKDGRPYRRYF